MRNSLVVILILAHKKNISAFEKASLKQCCEILGTYPIKLICPEGLDISEYRKVSPIVEVEFIEPKWQSTYSMFNKLKINKLLYEKFKEYKYILFYELDAWVFRDELEYWCNLDYDYIGAPWINQNLFDFINPKLVPSELVWIHKRLGNGRLLGKVGNGGFSLRKTKSCLNNILFFKKASSSWQANEDIFFSHYVKTFNPFFKIPKTKLALNFSFDLYPAEAFKKTKHLPFGCHAWYKSEAPYAGNFDFWKNIINYQSDLI